MRAGTAGRLRPHLDRARRRPARAAAARVRRRAAPRRLRARRGAGPRPAPPARRPDLDGQGRRRPRRRPAPTLGETGDRASAPATTASRPSREWAAWAGTIEHEIVTGLGARLDRDVRPVRGPDGACDAASGPGSPSSAAARTASTTSRWPRPPRSPARSTRRRYDVVRLTIDRDGGWRDDERRPLGLAGAVERAADLRRRVPGRCTARTARTARVAALCDLAGVPYVGSGVGAGALAMDKWATKLVAEALGVATGARRAADRGRGADVRAGRTRSWSSRSPPAPATASRLVARRRRARAGPRRGARARRPGAGRGRRRRPRDRRRRARPRRTARRSSRRRWRSSSTASSTPPRSTTAAPTSASPRRSTTPSARRSRTPPSRCTTRLGCAGRRPGRLLPHRRRPGAQRGQHDAGLHRALPGAEDVRRRRDRRTPSCSTCWSATPCA